MDLYGGNMLDRTIPFYNTILKCEKYSFQQILLPEAYRIVSYQPGFEQDWARLECAAGDFENEREAIEYFQKKYLSGDSCTDNLLFILESTGKVVGSCISWTDDRNGLPVNSLHWLIVEEGCQRKGLGRTLCTAAMNRFYQKGGEPVYIHTQPWSWKAILLYASLGFRIQKTDSFSSYINQYYEAMKTLKELLPEAQYRLLEMFAEE